MSTSRAYVRLTPPAAEGSSDTFTTRDRLAVRSPELDGTKPEALDHEGRLLDALQPHLRGVVGVLAGHDGNPIHLREGLRGDRNLHLSFLGRLMASSRPEAGAAIDALLDVLAMHRGKVAMSIEADQQAVLVAVAGYVKESAEAVAAAIKGEPNALAEAVEASAAGNALVAALLAERGK